MATAAIAPVPARITAATVAVARAARARDAARLKVDTLTAERADVTARIAVLVDVLTPVTRAAWCADFTEEAEGEVATVEIPGEDTLLLIAPGAPAPTAADGVLVAREAQSPEQVFWNAAVLPGWQKFRPTYRRGTITALDTSAETASVTIAGDTSSAQNLDINPTATLTNVPVQYMTCNAGAFEVGDKAVIKFMGGEWLQPKIVGFAENPRPCPSNRFYAVVWEPPAGMTNAQLAMVKDNRDAHQQFQGGTYYVLQGEAGKPGVYKQVFKKITPVNTYTPSAFDIYRLAIVGAWDGALCVYERLLSYTSTGGVDAFSTSSTQESATIKLGNRALLSGSSSEQNTREDVLFGGANQQHVTRTGSQSNWPASRVAFGWNLMSVEVANGGTYYDNLANIDSSTQTRQQLVVRADAGTGATYKGRAVSSGPTGAVPTQTALTLAGPVAWPPERVLTHIFKGSLVVDTPNGTGLPTPDGYVGRVFDATPKYVGLAQHGNINEIFDRATGAAAPALGNSSMVFDNTMVDVHDDPSGRAGFAVVSIQAGLPLAKTITSHTGVFAPAGPGAAPSNVFLINVVKDEFDAS